jgi:hypothetical protein
VIVYHDGYRWVVTDHHGLGALMAAQVRLYRWLWRAAYLREREEQERRRELAEVAGWAPLAFDSLRTERDRLYRQWELWAWRAAYLREREAAEHMALRSLLRVAELTLGVESRRAHGIAAEVIRTALPQRPEPPPFMVANGGGEG